MLANHIAEKIVERKGDNDFLCCTKDGLSPGVRAQFIDTFTVLILLCLFNEIEWSKFYGLLIAGVSFKILIAIADTPLLYLGVYLMRKRFNLKLNDTLKIN